MKMSNKNKELFEINAEKDPPTLDICGRACYFIRDKIVLRALNREIHPP